MRLLLPALLAAAAPLSAYTALELEGLQFLQRLMSMGYEAVSMRTLELELLQPCTLAVYTPWNIGGGFVIAAGGADVLDLSMRVEGEGWALEDTLPDDMPVLELTAGRVQSLRRVIVTVEDMLRSAPSESVIFMYALVPVDPAAPVGDFQEATEGQGAP